MLWKVLRRGDQCRDQLFSQSPFSLAQDVLRAVAVLALLYGCSLLGDDKPTVSGLWGGDQVELAATHSGVTLRYNCFSVTFPGPVRLIESDSFAATGTVTASSFAPTVGQRWRISGRLVRDTVYLTSSFVKLFTVDQWIGPSTDTLSVGHGAFYGLPCSE